MMRSFLLCLFVIASTTIPVRAEDWPRWRGPRGDGSWNAPRVAEQWPDDGLPIDWKHPVGGGYAGVTVADGLVYTLDRQTEPEEVERVLCFRADTGEPVFTDVYPAKYDDERHGKLDYRNGPRAAPTIHAGRVYALGAMGELRCLDAKTGALLWRKHLIDDLGGKLSMWGYSGSPFVYKDAVIVQPGGPEGKHVAALSLVDGSVRWSCLDDPAGYATPVLTRHNDRPLLILWTPTHVRGVDPDAGQPLWAIPYEVTYGVSIADPIVFEDLVFVSGYWEGSKAIRLGDSPRDATLAWEDRRWLRGLMSQPLQRGGVAYMLDKGYGLSGFDLRTGEKKWDDAHQLTPRGRNPQASLVWLGDSDRCLALNSDGDLVLTRLTPEGPTELARANIIDPTWAHPAYAGDSVYARSDTQLVRVRLPIVSE